MTYNDSFIPIKFETDRIYFKIPKNGTTGTIQYLMNDSIVSEVSLGKILTAKETLDTKDTLLCYMHVKQNSFDDIEYELTQTELKDLYKYASMHNQFDIGLVIDSFKVFDVLELISSSWIVKSFLTFIMIILTGIVISIRRTI